MKKLCVGALGAVFFAIIVSFLCGCSKVPPPEELNELRLGSNSTIDGSIDISISAPATLDGMTPESIGAVRARLTSQLPGLLAKNYTPLRSIFEKINPALSWESIDSFYLRGPSSMCGGGAAVDSDLIFNPYMLVGARFFGLGMKQSQFRWSQAARDGAATMADQIPLVLKPVSLRWTPKESQAEIFFKVSSYLKEAEHWLLNPVGIDAVIFSLNPINARDLGFKFMRFDVQGSSNVRLPPQAPSALQLLEIFTPRQLKSAVQSCNSSGWPYKTYRNLRLSGVPATLKVLFWRDNPNDLQSPDFTYVMNFD